MNIHSMNMKKEKEIIKEKNKYVEARGGRKTAVARVRLVESTEGITVNGKQYHDYFKMLKHRLTIESPLALLGGTVVLGTRGISVWVRGGGVTGQAEAIRHGLARVLGMLDEVWRRQLKHAGFLTRDSRAVERKKYGLKKARRAPQWAKR